MAAVRTTVMQPAYAITQRRRKGRVSLVGGTFVVANLLIAVVIDNLDKAKVDQLNTLQEPVSREELLRELRTTQETLRRLEDRLNGYGEEG